MLLHHRGGAVPRAQTTPAPQQSTPQFTHTTEPLRRLQPWTPLGASTSRNPSNSPPGPTLCSTSSSRAVFKECRMRSNAASGQHSAQQIFAPGPVHRAPSADSVARADARLHTGAWFGVPGIFTAALCHNHNSHTAAPSGGYHRGLAWGLPREGNACGYMKLGTKMIGKNAKTHVLWDNHTCHKG